MIYSIFRVEKTFNSLRKHAHVTFFLQVVKIENFLKIISYIFLIFAQIIDCVYTLDPPRRGHSNEYQQSMFWSKIRKWVYLC